MIKSNGVNGMIMGKGLIKKNNLNKIIYNQTAKPRRINLPNFLESKVSNKSFGIVQAFAANTNCGIVRGYNEDRISIILNI